MNNSIQIQCEKEAPLPQSTHLCHDQLSGFWYFGVWILLSETELNLIRWLRGPPL